MKVMMSGTKIVPVSTESFPKKGTYRPHPDDRTLPDKEYFDSPWHREQVKKLRHKLIKNGIISDPAYHPNNP